MNTQLIILAAGKGTRMNSDQPKVLVDLNGKPLILHLLDNVSKFIQNISPVIVVGYMRSEVINILGDKYTYAVQEEQLGTAHAVECGLQQAQAENVLVLYGDMPFISANALENLTKIHQSSKAMFSMLTATPDNFNNEFQSLYTFGRIIRDTSGQIQAIRELVDASIDEKKINEVNPGIYIFNTAWLKNNIGRVPMNSHGEKYLTDMVSIAIQDGLSIPTASVDPKEVLGINTVEQLGLASKLIEK